MKKRMQKYWQAIKWWEIRRIPFNLALLLAGTAVISVIFVVGGRLVAPGEDIVEPILLILGSIGYAIAANIFYTFGWITEILWSGGDVDRTAALRPRVYWLGLLLSVVVTLSPAVFLPILWLAIYK